MSEESYLPDFIESCSNEFVKELLRDVSYERLQEETKKFVRQSALRLKAGDWLYDLEPSAMYLSGEVADFKILQEKDVSSYFTPFIERQIFPPEQKFAVIGDIHGDIVALVTILEKLRADGFLDEEYNIIKEDFSLVFLGNYSNYGSYSVEVLRLLLHLHSRNIGNVFLLRGNNEYAVCNKFLYEEFSKISKEEIGNQDTLLGECARKFDVYYFPDLLYWYDYLPLSSFFGCRNEETGVEHFIQFVHAGIELGFNPQPLLIEDEVRFQKITRLNRYTALQKIIAMDQSGSLLQEVEESFDLLEKAGKQALVDTYTEKGLIDFTSAQSPCNSKLGMQWNSFLTADSEREFAVSLEQRTIFFGKKITDFYLKTMQDDKHEVHSIITAGQHFNEKREDPPFSCNMLDRLKENHGYVQQWGGRVYTLGDSGVETGYHSFLMVQFASNPADWKVEHWFKKVNDVTFTSTKFSLLQK